MQKYFYLLLAASMAVAPAYAEVNATSESAPAGQMFAPCQTRAQLVSDMSTPTKVPGLTAEDAIHVAPEGKLINLTRSGEAYYSYLGSLSQGKYSGMASEMVECENGEVYLKNPVSQLATNLYIKGRKETDRIVFDLPQVVYLESYYGTIYPYKLTNCVYSETDDTFYPVNSQKAIEQNLPQVEDTFVLEIGADGSMHYTAPAEGDVIVGLVSVDGDKWVGYGEIESLWEPVDYAVVAVPADLETTDVAVWSAGEGHYAKIGFDGDDVYMQGMFTKLPSAWIKGVREGEKITFASSQYTGVYNVYNCHTFFVAANYEIITNPTTGALTPILTFANEITFEYYPEESAMMAGENQTATLGGLPDEVAYLEYLREPVIEWFPADMSYDPVAPKVLEYDYSEKYGDLCVRFDLPLENKDGKLLDKNNIYYSFFVDGELFTFTKDVYTRFETDMSLFRYDWTDGRDIMFINGVHEAWFYFNAPKEVGIKAYYMKDGVTLGESMVSVASAGVEDVTVDNSAEVAGVEFYTPDGRRVANPATGLYIRLVRYSDGSVKTSKVVLK